MNDVTTAGGAAAASGGQDARRRDQEETLWETLLEYVAEGTVAPVVGRDLLSVEVPDPTGQPAPTLLYTAIARDLARALDVEVTPTAIESPNPLGAVTSQFILRGGVPAQIYRALPGVVKGIEESRTPGIPTALRQLAEIEPFKIFLTTTFDPLLANCVAQVRQTLPRVLTYSPQAASELSAFRAGDARADTLTQIRELQEPVVVHILGKLSARPNYVVTEEDAFEFVYSLQETRPEGLFDLLARMKLLIVGCRFPHWLVRFFLRTARRRRLLQSAVDRIDFLVDPTAADDAALVQFLRDFKTQTEIFTSYGPTEFIDELSRRWRARGGADQDPTADSFTPCSIFISYASEDARAAQEVAEAIQAVGLPVWLDRGRLGAGDDWLRKIRRNIDGAAAFVPLLSRSSLTTRSREFRKEWKRAYDVRDGLPRTEPFIYPLVLDDVPRGSEAIDEELRAINWESREADGTLRKAFTDRLRSAYRGALIRRLPG